MERAPDSGAKSTGRRAQNNLRRRTRLLESARELFRRHGYDATTMAQIARSARAAPRTVYNFFPTKMDLLGEILRQEAEIRMAAELAAEGPLPPNPFDGLMRLIEMQVRAIDAWPRHNLRIFAAHAIVSGLGTSAGRMHASADQFFQDEILERLRVYQSSGTLPPDTDVEALARAIFAANNGAYFSWLGGAADEMKELLAALRSHLALLLPRRGATAKVAPARKRAASSARPARTARAAGR